MNYSQKISAAARLAICFGLGLIAGGAVLASGLTKYVPLIIWDVTACLFAGSLLATILKFDANQTRQHARRENPGHAVNELILLIASLASLGAVALLLVQAKNAQGSGKILDIGLGLFSVVVSWLMVHVIYLVHYARLYYSGSQDGGVSFNQNRAPDYVDFAYLAFTLGMTFQVSDTNIESRPLRRAILAHALLSYLFGAVIVASTINFLVGLSQ